MASNNNKLPKGTTHIVMTHDAAFPARRAVDGWGLQNHNGEWVACGEQVSGYKVDVVTGILWEEPKVDVSGPTNPVKPGERIPAKFSCSVMQYAHDSGRDVSAFPRPGFYGRMATLMAIELRDLKAELAARDAIADSRPAMDVLEERRRQVTVEHRLASDDDDYTLGQLAYAAAAYASGSSPSAQAHKHRPSYWPWAGHWWKPGSPRRMLVKAGALILAEIERLDRVK